MTRTLALACLLLWGGLGRAAPATRVAAQPATAASDPAAAFDAAVDAHYDAMMDGRPCDAGCAQTIVRTRRLGRDLIVQLRHATTRYGDVYGVVLGTGGAWWAAEPIDDVQDDDCGAGTCVFQHLRSVRAWRDGARVWIVVRAGVRYVQDVARRSARYEREIAIGCQLGDAPRCARVDAGRPLEPGRLAIRGTIVHVTDVDGRHAVTIAF